MRIRTIALALSLTTLSVAALAAENNKFDLLDGKEKKIGTATYSVDKAKDGALKVHTTLNYSADDTASRTIDYKISADGKFLAGTNLLPSQQALTSYTPNKAFTSLEISNVTRDRPDSDRNITLSSPNFVILFADDPSVWKAFLDDASAHPNADHLYLILVPSSNSWTGDKIEHVRLSSPTESTGTFSGKPVKLQHYTVTFSQGKAELYTDADGKLMRAEYPRLNVRTVRSGFALDK